MIFNLPGYLISFLLGFLFLRTLRIQRLLSMPLALALAPGLGLGLSGILTFFSLLIFGQFNPWVMILVNVSLVFAFAWINMTIKPEQIQPPTKKSQTKLNSFYFYMIAFTIGFLLLTAIIILSQQFRFGGWDAWGLYNMKAKFIVFGGSRWPELATRLHDHTQPGYPILLPLINSWIFSFFQKNLITASSVTSIVLCASTGFLLYAGLQRFIDQKMALIGALTLTCQSWWIFWSTTQYADILLGYFLLANIILSILVVLEKNKNLSFTLGIFLGLMSFTKNEGIAMTIILSGLMLLSLFSDKTLKRHEFLQLTSRLFAGVFIGGICCMIFKIIFSPSNRDVKINPFGYELAYFNINGLKTITLFYFFRMIDKAWGFTWIILGVAGICQFFKLIKKECRMIFAFFIIYAVVLFYVYLTTVGINLAWRLSNTTDRILSNLLPSMIFFIFYALWKKNDQPKDL